MTLRIPETLKHRTIPLRDLQQRYKDHRILAGIAITTGTKLLLLQRSANEDMLPNMYELPGGHSEPEDGTIFDTVLREAKEETGLDVMEIVCEFEEFGYETTKGRAIQLNFLVRVGEEEFEPTLNPEEHQAFVWLELGEPGLGMLATLPMTPEMKRVVENALKAAGSTI